MLEAAPETAKAPPSLKQRRVALQSPPGAVRQPEPLSQGPFLRPGGTQGVAFRLGGHLGKTTRTPQNDP